MTECGWEGCEEEATATVGIVIGPFQLGPIDVPVCAEHLAAIPELMPVLQPFEFGGGPSAVTPV